MNENEVVDGVYANKLSEDNSPIPRHCPHVVRQLALGAGRHGRRELVEVPDVALQLGRARRQQVLLKRIEVQCLDRTGVLVLGEDERAFFPRDNLSGVVNRHEALVEAAYDHPGVAESVICGFTRGLRSIFFKGHSI